MGRFSFEPFPQMVQKVGFSGSSGKVLHGVFTPRLNSGTAEHIEAGVTPPHNHLYKLLRDFLFLKQHLENLVPVEDPVLAGKISSSCFSSNKGATRNMPFP